MDFSRIITGPHGYTPKENIFALLKLDFYGTKQVDIQGK